MSLSLPRLLLPAFIALMFNVSAAAAADDLLTPELIDATRQEARHAAELAHEYQRVYNEVQRDLDRNNLKLDSGVILSEQYRKRLNAEKTRLDKAGLALRRKVIEVTGTRDKASERMFELTYHWGRELYGFGSKQELDALIAERKNQVWALLAIVAFVVAIFGRFKRSGGQHITPLEVPDDLRRVRLPGLKYKVGWVTGLVADKEMWTETRQTLHTTTDAYVGHQSYVTTEVVTKGRLYLITHDGGEHVYDLSGADHRVRPGHLITSIDEPRLFRGTRTITDFNHSTREANHYNLWTANGTPWLVNLVVIGVLAYYGFPWAAKVGASVVAPTEHQFWLDASWAGLVGLGLALTFHMPITLYRNLRYKRGFVRKAWKLFDDQSDTLHQAFTPPTREAVAAD